MTHFFVLIIEQIKDELAKLENSVQQAKEQKETLRKAISAAKVGKEKTVCWNDLVDIMEPIGCATITPWPKVSPNY